MMNVNRPAFWFTLVAATFAVIAGVLFGSFPLGVPNEWAWERIAPVLPFWLLAVFPLLVASCYIGFVWLGARRIESCRVLELSVWLLGLAVGGFVWVWTIQEAAPPGYQLTKVPYVLYPREPSGYFLEARDEAGDLAKYLACYEEKVAQGDVLHIGTHPPGLTIVFRGLLGVCRTFPAFANLVIATEPDSARFGFEVLQDLEPISRADQATLWLAALLLHAGIVATIFPLFGLVRLKCSCRASWLAVAFWPTIPALAVFSPKSDCLFPLLTATILWLWLRGLAYRSRGASIACGVVLWVGMTISIAFLPILMIMILTACWSVVARRKATQTREEHCGPPSIARDVSHSELWKGFRELFPSLGFAAIGFLVPCFAGMIIWRLNLPAVWIQNLHNHVGFYEQFPRTYWKWLFVTPIEFAVAAGMPLAILGIWGMMRERQSMLVAWQDSAGLVSGEASGFGLAWSWLFTISLLWLTGRNMGEAGRHLILLMPVLIWIVASLFEPCQPVPLKSRGLKTSEKKNVRSSPMPTWCVALALQFVTTLVIVTHVAGFQYHP